jgi:hypothetical protein
MTLQPFICDASGVYRSGNYQLVPSTVGFGFVVTDIMHHGKHVYRTTGHNSLNLAQAWCRDHEAGKNMAEEVWMPHAGGQR